MKYILVPLVLLSPLAYGSQGGMTTTYGGGGGGGGGGCGGGGAGGPPTNASSPGSANTQPNTSYQSPSADVGPFVHDAIEQIFKLNDHFISHQDSHESIISTVPEEYEFEAPEGEMRDRNESLYEEFNEVEPENEIEETAKEMGMFAIEESDQSYEDPIDAEFFHDLAEGLLDIALGLDPVSGLGRSAYELLTGDNVVTGEALSKTERSIAFLGVVTAGGGRSITQAGKLMHRVYEGTMHLLHNPKLTRAFLRQGEALALKVEHVLQGFSKHHEIVAVRKAEKVNEDLAKVNHKGWFPSFQEGTHVVEFTTTHERTWLRVHTGNNREGQWLLKRSSIKGLSPREIQIKYALKSPPTHVSEVRVPGKTSMARGSVQYHKFHKYMPKQAPSGAVQYLLKERIPAENFTNTKRIGEFFK